MSPRIAMHSYFKVHTWAKLSAKLALRPRTKANVMASSHDYDADVKASEAAVRVPQPKLDSETAKSSRDASDSMLIANPRSTTCTSSERDTRAVILAKGLQYPASAAFDRNGHLWFTELNGANLCRLNRDKIVRVPLDGAPDGIVFDPFGRVLYCDAQNRSIRRHDPKLGKTKTLVGGLDGKTLFMPKDLAFDAIGNLAFTCPGDSTDSPTGYVCVLTRSGTIRRIGSGFCFPSGLAFSLDGRYLVVAETCRQRLWRGYWDMKRARWSELRPWADVGGAIGPAGMAYGADGLLYVTIQGDGTIKTITPNGVVKIVAQLPGSLPTNCAFDPYNSLGLVVTEAKSGRLMCLPFLGPGAPVFARSSKPSLLRKCLSMVF